MKLCMMYLLVFLFLGIPSVCKQVISVETTRDIEWATYTCTLGFQVFGKRRLLHPPPVGVLMLSYLLISIAFPPQACGPMAQMALTSTLSAGPMTGASWLLEMILEKSVSSHIPVHSSE